MAILETVAAVTLALALSVFSGNFWLVASWSAIGWMLLLQTKTATAIGVAAFEPVFQFCEESLSDFYDDDEFKLMEYDFDLSAPFAFFVNNLFKFGVLFLTLVTLVSWSLICRIYSTTRALIRHPWRCIRAIPRNWKHAAFSLDVAQPFEFVPGHNRAVQRRLRSVQTPTWGATDSLDLGAVSVTTLLRDLLNANQVINLLLGFGSTAVLIVLLSRFSGAYLTLLHATFPSFSIGSAIAWIMASLVGMSALITVNYYTPRVYDGLKRRFPPLQYIENKIYPLLPALAIIVLLAFMGWNIYSYAVSPTAGRQWGKLALLAGVTGLLLALSAFSINRLIRSPARIILYLPALGYRMALKATTLTYLPLIWAVDGTTRKRPLQDRLEDLSQSQLSKLIRFVSWTALALFAGKIFVYSYWDVISHRWNALAFAGVLNILVIPHKMPLWHYAIALNVGLH